MALRRVATAAASAATRAAAAPAPVAPVAARAFAAKAEKAPEAPVQLFGTAGRYATALYAAAAKAKTLDKVDAELKQVVELTTMKQEFKDFLFDSSMAREAKAKAVMELLGQFKYCDTTKNFFGVMAENGRLAEMPKIAENFDTLMCATRGEVKAVITSAEPLTPAQLSPLRESLNKYIEKGQTISLSTKVDPSIIGGVKVDIGDKHIDLSVDTKIRKMEALLLETA